MKMIGTYIIYNLTFLLTITEAQILDLIKSDLRQWQNGGYSPHSYLPNNPMLHNNPTKNLGVGEQNGMPPWQDMNPYLPMGDVTNKPKIKLPEKHRHSYPYNEHRQADETKSKRPFGHDDETVPNDQGYQMKPPQFKNSTINGDEKMGVQSTSGSKAKEKTLDNIIDLMANNRIVKNKLLGLVKDTLKDIDTPVDIITKVHDRYKDNKMYKLGYVVCYMNKTKDNIIELTKNIEKEKEDYDVLKILDVYEKIKKSKKFLSKSLIVLKKFLQPQTSTTAVPYPETKDDEREGQTSKISWSYYNDVM